VNLNGLSAAQARLVLDTLLRLYELGCLAFEGSDGPNAYNMGPSSYTKGDERC
jgi:hypothetical protein